LAFLFNAASAAAGAVRIKTSGALLPATASEMLIAGHLNTLKPAKK
jgi:hypothetical protein